MKKLNLLALIGALLALTSTGLYAGSVAEALAKPGRLEADIQRDARSRPDVVIPLLQLQVGDRVADIFGGGGYYSELLATVVGEEGEVLLQNNKAYKQFVTKALDQRFTDRVTGNITLLDSQPEDLKLGKGQLDAALIVMSYHDLFYADPENGWAAIDSADFLKQIYHSLNSGGRFLIVDHAAQPGSGIRDAQKLHRIDEAFARNNISSYGFRLIGSSDGLRNAADDHTTQVFDPAIRGKTDRFILVFEKP